MKVLDGSLKRKLLIGAATLVFLIIGQRLACPGKPGDALVGSYSDSPNGPVMVEVTKGEMIYQAVISLRGQREQVAVFANKGSVSERLFGNRTVDNWTSIGNDDGLAIVTAPKGTVIGANHMMETEYCLCLPGIIPIDLYKK